MNHSNKPIAIITGGASGLGLAIALKFAANHIFSIVIGRDQSKLDAAQEKLGENGTTISYDLSELKGIPALMEKIHTQFGRLDILVNNAGINQKKEFTEVTDEEFNRIMQTNVTAVFALSREAVKIMEPQGSGNIILISSMAAMYGLPKVIAYSASKSAIEGMTKAMAVELSPKGIRVNAIAPGFIYSAMTDKALNDDPERKGKVFGRTPMGKMGEADDIAEMALFLATEKSKYITGTSIRVDGGNAIGF